MSTPESATVRAQLEKLAAVSQDLDRHTQLSKTASHPIQAQQVRKRIDELTGEQSQLMQGLVSQHPNAEAKSRFNGLERDIDDLRDQIRGCDDQETLADLEKRIEETVDRWVHAFQIIVSELTGVRPPDGPVYGEPSGPTA